MADEIDIEGILQNLDLDENIEICHDFFEDEIEETQSVFQEEEIVASAETNILSVVPKLVEEIVVEREEEASSSVSETSTKPSICQYCKKRYKNDRFKNIHEKRCPKKPTPSIEKQNFMIESSSFLEKCLEAAADEPIHNITETGRQVKLLSDNILKLIINKENSEKTQEFKLQLASRFFIIINFVYVNPKEKEHMFEKFNHLSVDDMFLTNWNEFISCRNNFPSKISSLLWQYVLDRYLHLSLVYRTKSLILEEESAIPEITIDTDEEETIRYIAGYIVFSLRKGIRYKTSAEGKVAIQILDMWGSKVGTTDDVMPTSLLEYTEAWTNRVNRGGLISVCDEFFLFIREIEIEARKVINKNWIITYCGDDVHSLIYQSIDGSTSVSEAWDNLTYIIDNLSLKNMLRKKIIKKWINLRIKSFIKTWLQIMRLDASANKPSRKGETSMRKGLH